MRDLKIREDRLGKGEYKCSQCGKAFQDGDIIRELEVDDIYEKFCPVDCLMKWFEDYIELRKVVVYPMAPEQRTIAEIADIIVKMKPYTKERIGDRFVEYFDIEGMVRHYVVYDIGGYNKKLFAFPHEVVAYLTK